MKKRAGKLLGKILMTPVFMFLSPAPLIYKDVSIYIKSLEWGQTQSLLDKIK